MDEKRKREIALIVLKEIMKKRPINFLVGVEKKDEEDEKSELEKVSEKTGIPVDELKEFSLILFKEITEETHNEIKKGFQAED